MKKQLSTLLILCLLIVGLSYANTAYAGNSQPLELKGVTLSDAYPNPATAFVSFNYTTSNLEGEASLEIFNLIGEVVIKENLNNSGTIRVSVNKLEKGIYFYRLAVNGDKSQIKKLIVQ